MLPEQWRHLYNCFNPSRHPSFDVSELIFEGQTIKDDICSFIEARATSAPPSAKQVAAKQKRKARDSDNEDSDDELVAANVNQASSLPAKARQSPKKKSKAIVVEAPAPKKKGLAKKQKNTQSKEQEANAAALADVMRASARSARDERKARRDVPAHVVEAS